MINWYDNVPAPTDRNGRMVPLDTRELAYKGETREVLSIIYNIERGCWSVSFGWFDSVPLSACTLPDSWERLEKDVYHLVMSEYLDTPEDDVKGIVRRAKALAGVTDGE